MIISLPLGILQLLLLNAADTSAFTSQTFANALGAISTTKLYDIDPTDPYASVLEAYQKKNKVSADISISLPADPSIVTTTSIPDTSAIADAPSNEDLLEAINNVASAAIDASNQASQAAASISDPASAYTAAAVTAAKATAVAATATASTTASDGTGAGVSEKAPSLVEYFSKISSGEDAGGVGGLSVDAKERLLNLKTNAAPISSAIKDSVSSASKSYTDVSGKVPTLVDYLSKGGADPSGLGVSGSASATGEKWMMLKNNLINAGSSIDTTALSEKSRGFAEVSTKSLSVMTAGMASGAGAAVGTSTGDLNLDSIDMSKLIENLQLDEYGAWYVSAFTLLYAVNQKEAGKQQARQEFEEELAIARARADEAANAAVVAAEGAKIAKDLVQAIPSMAGTKSNVGDELIENSRVRQLEVSNDFMQQDLANLKLENAEQKNMIQTLMSKKSKKQSVEDVPIKIEIPVGKSIMERDPNEDVKILSILETMDKKNAAAKKKLEASVKKSKPKKKKAAKKKKAVANKVTTIAEAPAIKTKKKAVVKKAVKKPTETVAAADSKLKKKKAAKKKTQIKKSALKEDMDSYSAPESAADKALKEIEAAEESFNDAMAESSKEADLIEEMKNLLSKPTNSGAPKATAPPKKKKSTTTRIKVTATAPNTDENPWGKLKESTLKRKTVAQLTAYLNERQITIEGLSKTELVGTIQKL